MWLWAIIVILLILWLLGFIGSVGGSLIHLLLVVAVMVATPSRPPIPPRREQIIILTRADALLAYAQQHGRDERGVRLVGDAVTLIVDVWRSRVIEQEFRER